MASISVDPHNRQVVYAGLRSEEHFSKVSVYRTENGGVSWQAMGAGLHGLTVFALAINPKGTVVHAATFGGGVFSRRVG